MNWSLSDFHLGLFLFLFLGIAILIFLLLREFWCWYWKINKRIALLESVEKKLSIITNTESILDAVETPSEELSDLSNEIEQEKEAQVCSHCSKETTDKMYYCPSCEKYFCYSCIKAGAKCSVCNSRLIR
jgi:hypothetical protein